MNRLGRARSVVASALAVLLAASPAGAAGDGALRPPLRTAAQVRAMTAVCVDALAGRGDELHAAAAAWWERHQRVWDALHALEFGRDDPERRDRLAAFEAARAGLETSLRTEAREDTASVRQSCEELLHFLNR